MQPNIAQNCTDLGPDCTHFTTIYKLYVSNVMEEPIHLGRPIATISLLKLFVEVRDRLKLAFVDFKSFSQVLDVLDALQLRNACVHHHGEERDQQIGVLSQR